MSMPTSRSSEGFHWHPTGSITGLETEAAIKTSSTCANDYEVIVIGSGFAGLVAARDLSQHTQARVLLIEARDRIGGRTWTAKVADEHIEMGGTWVHWNQPHVYNELHRYRLQSRLKTSDGCFEVATQYYKPSSGPIQEVLSAKVNEICEKVAERLFQIDGYNSRSLMPYPHDPQRAPALWKKYDHLSLRDGLDMILDIPQSEKSIFESMVNSFGSCPATELGFTEVLRWYALGGHTMASTYELAGVYKIGGGGMTSLALAMFGDYKGDILLKTPVSEIKQSATGVVVTTKSGKQIRSKSVISTIPLNCLRDVSFYPPLSPLRQEAIQRGHINVGAKIHFKLAATQPGWFASCESSPTAPFLFSFSDHNGNQASGPNGTWCIGFGYNGHLTDPTDSAHFIKEFKRNIKADAEVQLYATHDWASDPYAKGTWSAWGPGSMSKYLAELQKSDGRVIFASADWADGWRGFVDGAIERGRMAAQDATLFLDEKLLAKL